MEGIQGLPETPSHSQSIGRYPESLWKKWHSIGLSWSFQYTSWRQGKLWTVLWQYPDDNSIVLDTRGDLTSHL
jgi:hypothetical protein